MSHPIPTLRPPPYALLHPTCTRSALTSTAASGATATPAGSPPPRSTSRHVHWLFLVFCCCYFSPFGATTERRLAPRHPVLRHFPPRFPANPAVPSYLCTHRSPGPPSPRGGTLWRQANRLNRAEFDPITAIYYFIIFFPFRGGNAFFFCEIDDAHSVSGSRLRSQPP